ncbi:MAG: polyprenyl synthetase family protein [Negativicutes bacterium]|nr:polyprenyl synthetase family protein [Negativicutes bacterium]
MKQHAIFDLVRDELMAVENELASVIRSQVDLVTDIGSHLLRAGGKRLRPALYFLCAKSGQPAREKMLPAAVAIELIHMATLVHDDVIDEATTRRGLPTASVRWGNHMAVLSGDYLFAKAFSLIAGDTGSPTLKVLTETICAVCEGEIIQIRDIFNPEQSEADYLDRIDKKTAGFIAASCELGAGCAGLAAGEIRGLRQYGHTVGMAFQITDDILDVTASSEQIGKPAGNDLRQGVLTMPVIYALSHSKHSAELKQLISARDMSEAKLKQIMAIIHETDAVEYSYRRVGEYLEAARNSIPRSLTGGVKESLLEVADFVGLRKY